MKTNEPREQSTLLEDKSQERTEQQSYSMTEEEYEECAEKVAMDLIYLEQEKGEEETIEKSSLIAKKFFSLLILLIVIRISNGNYEKGNIK